MPPITQQFLNLLQRGELSNYSTLLKKCYFIAIELGAEQELDFFREEGVSYNPRPARVSYILVNNCKIFDPTVLAAAILGCLEELKTDKFTAFSLPKDVLILLEESRLCLEKPEKTSRNAQLIAIAIHLDRIRHIHLSPNKNCSEFLEPFIQRTQFFIKLAEDQKLPLANYLLQWKNRAEKWIL